ncbi:MULTISPECIES: hypothetical protein [Serratia]|uniref:hypothetical protein n=1 Tax=Serratia TaxID=613 RepID=UPI000B24C67B|nr:hypothetical protein [Serratia sp. 506_PEND]
MSTLSSNKSTNHYDKIQHAGNTVMLASALRDTAFNCAFIRGDISYADIKFTIQVLAQRSLSLAVTFTQHLQVLYALYHSELRHDLDLSDTGLISSATTSIKGPRLSTPLELENELDTLQRECPIVSYFDYSSHLLFTGVHKKELKLFLVKKQKMQILHSEDINCLGMSHNHIKKISFQVKTDECVIIRHDAAHIINDVLAFYAHLLWSVAWSASFDRAVEYTMETRLKLSKKLSEDFYAESLSKLLNQSHINNQLIAQLESRHLNSLSWLSYKDKMAFHTDVNSLKIIVSENVTSGIESCLLILGFKKGYVVDNDFEFTQLYCDIKSSQLMFNNSLLHIINLDCYTTLKSLQRRTSHA